MNVSYDETSPRRDSPYTIKVLEKAFALLDLLANGPCSLRELSAAPGLNKTTAFRLLAALEEHGYVVKNLEDGQYCLGPKLLELGCRLLPGADLLGLARSAVSELVDTTRETAEVSVRQGHEALIIASQSGPQLNTPFIPVGTRLPLHRGASARILLAFSSEDFVENYLSQPTLARGTPYTIASAEQLRCELAAIRQMGYAMSFGEVDRAVSGVSVPIRNGDGQVAATLAVVVPASRGDRSYLDQLRSHVLRIGADFSHRLGFRGS